MQKYISILLIIGSTAARAQTTFQIASADTQEILSGATVSMKDAKGQNDLQIADGSGMVKSPLSLPLQAEVRYQGYQTLYITILDNDQLITLTPQAGELEDVVITGQYAPQSAKNALYNVRTIGTDRITKQNANSIIDVLSNELNISIGRDNATGRAGISMQGLSGQYAKILVDGVPMVGRGGLDNDIDLSQIDIQQVERIEIVEGPMAVNYGADALAGVINIITKKGIDKKVMLSTTLQTETTGADYSLFEEGTHSPAVSLGYQIHDRWYAQLSGRYYRFGGWQGTAEGRQKQWLPKEQWFGGLLMRYETKKWSIHYRLDALDETIHTPGALIAPTAHEEPYAFDEDFVSNRYMHQLQSQLSVGQQAQLTSVVSYTDYERLTENYRRFPLSDVALPIPDNNDTIFYRTYFTRQSVDNLRLSDRIGLQIGAESTHEVAGGSTLHDGDKTISEVAGFVSGEVVFAKLKVRPGIRYTLNSQFATIPTPAVNFYYRPSEQTQVRWSYGRGFRAPAARELFHEFIDANHNLVGNPDLQPETSHNFNASIDQSLSKLPLSFELGGFYNNVKDRIDFSISSDGREQSYINLSTFKTTGGTLRATYQTATIEGTVGISRIGRLQRLREVESVPDYVFSTELIARLQYTVAPVGITIAPFYKYTGSVNRYRVDDDTQEIEEVGTPGFHTLDINLSKTIGPLQTGMGIRNALDITNLDTVGGGGAHSGGGSLPIGYGRSYYLRLHYVLNY